MRKRSRQSSKNSSSACSKRSEDRLAATPITKNDRGEVVGLGLAEFQLQPGDAAIIGKLPELSRLSLQRSNVKDEDLQEFKGLKKLTALNLWDAKIGDAGVAALTELSALQSLQLGGDGNHG